ncbi:MAG: hypothetical protein QM706_11610 [Nitrospira sp.]
MSIKCIMWIGTRHGRKIGASDGAVGPEGKVVYVGSSNFAGWHLAQAQETARGRHFMGLVSEQSLYNLNERTVELEVIPACEAMGSV